MNPWDDAENLSLNQQEYKLQVAVVKHLASAFPSLLYTHVPNKAASAKDGFFHKQMGVRAGVADLIFWYRSERSYPASMECAAIELKAVKGRQSPDQNKFASSFTYLGGKYAICKSVKEVHETLKLWGIKAAHDGVIEPDTRSENQKFSDAFGAFAP